MGTGNRVIKLIGKFSRFTRHAVIAWTFTAVVTAAQAEWYLGLDHVPAKKWYELDDYSIAPSTYSDTDPGIKFLSGYRANDLFSIEFEYKEQMEFGVGDVFTGKELWLTDQRDIDLDSKALFFSGVSTFEIDSSKRLFLRGGIYNWDLNPGHTSGLESTLTSNNGTDLFYSIGSYFDVSKKIRLSAEWERFEYDKQDVDFISTELQFNF